MLEPKLRQVLLGSLAAGALVVGLGVSPAAAVPAQFTIDTDAVPGTTSFNLVTGTHFQGPTEGRISQTGPTQTEVGWVRLAQINLLSTPLNVFQTGLTVPGGAIPGDYWGSYILFDANAALPNFNPGTQGALTSFNFAWYLDPVVDTALSAATVGSNPTRTGGFADDLLVAVGTLVPGTGSAGFQAGTGAPIFSAMANFILCNGTPGAGVQGATPVAGTTTIDGTAHTCGTFDGTSFFVAPDPFYEFDFNAATASSAGDVIVLDPTHLRLTGVTASISFQEIPEPGTLMLVGFGLLGLGWVTRRRSRA